MPSFTTSTHYLHTWRWWRYLVVTVHSVCVIFTSTADHYTRTVCRQTTSGVYHFINWHSVMLQRWTTNSFPTFNSALSCLESMKPRWWTAGHARQTRASFCKNFHHISPTVISHRLSMRLFRCATCVSLQRRIFSVIICFFSQWHSLDVRHDTSFQNCNNNTTA